MFNLVLKIERLEMNRTTNIYEKLFTILLALAV